MSKNNQPDKKLRDEAEAYVDNLPDETAAARLVDDGGDPADIEAWNREQARQQAVLKTDKPMGTGDRSPETSIRDKQGNQSR